MGRKREGPSGCMFYTESLRLLAYLSDAEAGRVIKAAAAYFLTGESPEDMEHTTERMAYEALCNDVDRSLERYREICERNRANRSRGCLPSGEHYVLPD